MLGFDTFEDFGSTQEVSCILISSLSGASSSTGEVRSRSLLIEPGRGGGHLNNLVQKSSTEESRGATKIYILCFLKFIKGPALEKQNLIGHPELPFGPGGEEDDAQIKPRRLMKFAFKL